MSSVAGVSDWKKVSKLFNENLSLKLNITIRLQMNCSLVNWYKNNAVFDWSLISKWYTPTLYIVVYQRVELFLLDLYWLRFSHIMF